MVLEDENEKALKELVYLTKTLTLNVDIHLRTGSFRDHLVVEEATSNDLQKVLFVNKVKDIVWINGVSRITILMLTRFIDIKVKISKRTLGTFTKVYVEPKNWVVRKNSRIADIVDKNVDLKKDNEVIRRKDI